MCESALSVSACVKQDEQDNTTIAPFQIFDLSGAEMQKLSLLCPSDISSIAIEENYECYFVILSESEISLTSLE